MPGTESPSVSSPENIVKEVTSDSTWANGKTIETNIQSANSGERILQDDLDAALFLEALEKAREAWDPPEQGGNRVMVIDYRNPDWEDGKAQEVILTIPQKNYEGELKRAQDRVSKLSETEPPSDVQTPVPVDATVPHYPVSERETKHPIEPLSPESAERVAWYGKFTVVAESEYDTIVGHGKRVGRLDIPLLGATKDDIDENVLKIGFDHRNGNLKIDNISRWNEVQVAIKLAKTDDEELPDYTQRTDDGWVTIRLKSGKYSKLSPSQSGFLNDHLRQSDGLAITIDQSENLPDYNPIRREKMPHKTFRIISEPKDWNWYSQFPNSLESITFRQVGFGEGVVTSGNVVAPELNTPANPTAEANTLERSLKENETYRDILATNDDALERNAQITADLVRTMDYLYFGDLKEKEKVRPSENTEISEVRLEDKVHINCQERPIIVIGGNIPNSAYYQISPGTGTEWINIQQAEKELEPATVSLTVDGSEIIPHPLGDRPIRFNYRNRNKDGAWESMEILNPTESNYAAQQKQIAEITAGLDPHNFWLEVESRDQAAEAYEINFTDLKETETDGQPRITDLTFFVRRRGRGRTG